MRGGSASAGNNSTDNSSRRGTFEGRCMRALGSAASSNGRHYGNTIIILQRGRFLLQVADVFVVEVNVHKGAQLAVLGVEMAAQVGMPGNQAVEGLADIRGADVHRGLLVGVLAERSGDVNLCHSAHFTTDAASGNRDSPIDCPVIRW